MTITTLREFLEEISGMPSHHWKEEAIAILEPLRRAEQLALCNKGQHAWNDVSGYCTVCEVQREAYLQDLLSEERARNAERKRAQEVAQRYNSVDTPKQRNLFEELPHAYRTPAATMALNLNTPISSVSGWPTQPPVKTYGMTIAENFEYDPKRNWD